MRLDLYSLFMPYLYYYRESGMYRNSPKVKCYIGFSAEHSYTLDRYFHYAWIDYMSRDGMTRSLGRTEVFQTFKPSSRINLIPKDFLWEADDVALIQLLDRNDLWKIMMTFGEPVGFVDSYLLPLPDDKPVLFKHVVNGTVHLAILVVKAVYSPRARGVVPKQHADLFIDGEEGILGLSYERGVGTVIDFRTYETLKRYYQHPIAGKPWLDAEGLDDLMLVVNRMMGHKFTVRTPEKFYALLSMKALEAKHGDS